MAGQITSNTPRHFKPIGQPWRNCYSEMGRMYPQSEMTEYEGKWYCKEHARAKIYKETWDHKVEIEEEPNELESVGSDYTAVTPDTFGNTDRT